MAIKSFKPTSPGVRSKTVNTYSEVTGSEPERSLLVSLERRGGRNNKGRITAKYKGGGTRKQYRIIDFLRNKDGIPAKVHSIEYDPNRSANIALLHYRDGEKRYILAPQGIVVGETLMSGPDAEIKVGNNLPLRKIPVGSTIHNVEMRKGKGGQIARSAGISAQLLAKEGKWVHIRLPSREVRLVELDCRATLGQTGNSEHESVTIGKAGRNRWKGIRPRTRAVVMNPVDHPMGGGEGRSSGGRHPCSFSCVPSKGYKTRKKKKSSDRFIVKKRNKR